MTSKPKFASEQHRDKILNESIFGIWTDPFNTIELKIAPSNAHVRVKIIEVKDPSVMERISFFCGLHFLPKRANWKGFDFITHLEQVGQRNYSNGQVHMPHAERRNYANLKIISYTSLTLEFYFIDPAEREPQPRYVGTFPLEKKYSVPPTLRDITHVQ